MRLALLVLFASALLLLGCAGYSSAPPASANGQQPPAGSSQQPAPSQAAPAPASSASVDIANFAFSPAEMTVAKGATVTWTNRDSVEHTITSGLFDSGNIKNGESFSFAFTQAGAFEYHCSIHPSMKGKITVTG